MSTEKVVMVSLRSVQLGRAFCVGDKIFVRADLGGGNGYSFGFSKLKDNCVPCAEIGAFSSSGCAVFNFAPSDVKHLSLDELVCLIVCTKEVAI